MKAIGYIRVSSTGQAQDGYGLDVQTQEVVDYCREHGYELVSVESDPGARGALPLGQRPGLRSALEVVRERRDDPVPVGVVVTRFNRLGRDTLESLLAEREFVRAGARVEYVDGLNGDTPELKFMRTVMHGMSELDKDLLVAKLANGKAAKKARDGATAYTGGRPRIGYRGHKGALVVDEDAARVVRFIFLRVAKDRWSTRRVASVLDERRALGRRWDQSKVRKVLHHDGYKLGKDPMVDPRVWNRAHAVLANKRGVARV